ncbi:FAD:protein FMN transferase [Candidatus Rhodoluna planktonica]|uniref:FAD:protein FMN transferase n=1 Tax=Candidatus Rhodoluna planktonica TaxID=535712 RepID=A0A1D9E0N1_9MICO|nr:FAD:protein FMN transferase [Candidatus Rhodoluna planktonica]AOY56614.1 hypothetical protein A4Z71_06665 [Candidatus Rhodoluna planktonica]
MIEFDRTELCMGTAFTLSGRTELSSQELDQVIAEAWQILHDADLTFSLYKPHSPLSRLYRGEASLDRLPAVVAEIWDACDEWEVTTEGWFSAMTPEHTFDPSGLVKTWAAKNACAVLENAGIDDFTMNAGGDVYLSKKLSDQRSGRIAIHQPISIAEAHSILTVLDLNNTEFRAVATSGYAERGKHIWNPKASLKAANEDWVQVSVVADDLVRADVWATAAMAAGLRAPELLNRQANLEALFVRPMGELAATDGLLNLFAKPN